MTLVYQMLWCTLALSLNLSSPSLYTLQSSSSPASESLAESDVRALAERYRAMYADKNLDGLMRLWSPQSPVYKIMEQALEKTFAAQDTSIGSLTINRVKLDGARAELRVTLEVMTTGKKSGEAIRELQTSNFHLVREKEEWRLWEITRAVDDLAAELERITSEEEQDRLLTQEIDLVDRALLTSMKELSNNLSEKGDHARGLRTAQLAARIAEKIGDRPELANAWIELGAIHARQNRFAQALDYLQKGHLLFEEMGDKKGIARALKGMGNCKRLQDHPDQALEYYIKSLEISEETGDKSMVASILRDIGILHKSEGRYELALQNYQRSRGLYEELSDKAGMQSVLVNIGNVHQSQGRYELALEFHQKSRVLSEELNDPSRLQGVLNNIGVVYTLQGHFAQALEHLQKSLKIDEEMGSAAEKRDVAIHLNNIGLVYNRQGRYEQAMDYYLKSLKILEEVNDKRRIGGAQNNIGVICKLQGFNDQAMDWFRKSLKLFEETADERSIAMSLNNIGDIYRRQGRYDLAQENLQKSLELRQKDDPMGISRTLNHLSRLYQDKGSYAEMLEVSRRAEGLAQGIRAQEELWEAQDKMGKAFRALGQPEQARRSFLAAIATVESLRDQIAGGAQQQQSFLEERVSPWLSMIDLLVSQHQYAEALTFAEGSKARVLLDALQAGGAKIHKSLSPPEQKTEEEQRLRLVTLNTRLAEEMRRKNPDQARVTELKANIDKARLDFEALETNLYVAHPELKIHRGIAPTINAEELGTLLPDAESALLEFVVTDDKTYLFAITGAAGGAAAEVQVYTLPVRRDELTMLIESFRQQLAGRDLGFRSSAVKLDELLLKPARVQLKGKKNLVIVPDDKLWDLPFQALLTGANRFLLEDAAVAYAPSLTVLRDMARHRQNRHSDAASPNLLALGNPLLGQETIERATLALRDERLTPLPEAEQEVRALGLLYGKTHSWIYTGPDAREDRVKTDAGQAGILHFATHGILNNAAPMYSNLLLARGDKNEDGLLEAWELMQLDLRAELAVLSACETARGRYGAGEGMIGLTWALFVAGVPTTVVSQWKVESASTRDLMVHFYRALKAPSTAGRASQSKAEALRQAALSLMRSGETGHPFYWAAFVLVGDGR